MTIRNNFKNIDIRSLNFLLKIKYLLDFYNFICTLLKNITSNIITTRNYKFSFYLKVKTKNTFVLF